MKLFKLINLVSPDLYQLFHMLVGEVQAQHGMKITDWKNPERSLELQPGDQPANIPYDPPQVSTG